MNNIVLFPITIDELKELIKNTLCEELKSVKAKEILSSKETCELLGVSRSTLNKWKSEQLIPYRKKGKRVFFIKEDILNAMHKPKYLIKGL